MHHCLYISEVLGQIFTFVGRDDQLPQASQAGQKALASLARTCQVFSSPALDVLWHDLDGFEPLLRIFPVATTTSCVDHTQWSTFRKYAKRVKILRGCEARVPVPIKQDIITALCSCPEVYLPLLPNVTELGWSERPVSSPEASGIALFRHFASHTVTTVTLSLMRWRAHSPTELAVLADLPRLCPNVTSFNLVLYFSWDYIPSEEVGSMVTQWPKLQTLQTCAIPQPVMDQLFSRRTLESLYIEYYDSSPIYVGRIPDTVREFTLGAERPPSCSYFLKTTYASPTTYRLLIGMNEGQEEEYIKETFQLLPRRLDTSLLLSLTIQPRSSIVGISMWRTLTLQESLMSSLVEFRALRELDLDLLCTANMTDADYEHLAGSMRHLRSLKLGTSNPSIARPWPMATVGAVIAVLLHCTHLETLHIVFNGSVPPPGYPATRDGQVARMEETARQGWGVSNRRITKLCVGSSPIVDATIDVIASCFKAIMPCLTRIEYRARDEEWRLVQHILESCHDEGHLVPVSTR